MTLAEARPEAAEVIAPLVGGRVSVSAGGLRLGAGVDSAHGLASALVRALDQAEMLVDAPEPHAHLPGADAMEHSNHLSLPMMRPAANASRQRFSGRSAKGP